MRWIPNIIHIFSVRWPVVLALLPMPSAAARRSAEAWYALLGCLCRRPARLSEKVCITLWALKILYPISETTASLGGLRRFRHLVEYVCMILIGKLGSFRSSNIALFIARFSDNPISVTRIARPGIWLHTSTSHMAFYMWTRFCRLGLPRPDVWCVFTAP